MGRTKNRRAPTRVAVFEDDAIDRFIFDRTFMDSNQITIDLFNNPDIGLAHAHMDFDVVIIDLHFWGSHYGMSIRDQWAMRCKNSPLYIATSPLLQENDRENAISGGFHYIFEKPDLFRQLEPIILHHFAVTERLK